MIHFVKFDMAHSGHMVGNFTGIPDVVRFNLGFCKVSSPYKRWNCEGLFQ